MDKQTVDRKFVCQKWSKSKGKERLATREEAQESHRLLALVSTAYAHVRHKGAAPVSPCPPSPHPPLFLSIDLHGCGFFCLALCVVALCWGEERVICHAPAVGARLVVWGVVIHAHLAHHTHLAGHKKKGGVSGRRGG